MGLGLIILAVLVLGGGRQIMRAAAAAGSSPGRWPAVALIIPVTGAAPGLDTRLASLLNQDYPDYQVILVTRAVEDPATPVILSMMAHHPRARHVLSGPAHTCGQKNHNLLAGLKLAGPATEVLAFCDSNQMAPATWLKELVRPIATGEAEVVSGYHHIIPHDFQLATWTRALIVLILFMVKGFSRFNQPWGGSTAIKRSLFQALEVDKLWGENVVDDVSLAARLLSAGVRAGLPGGAALATPLKGETFSGLSLWLTRQWLYLKFCLPATWLVGGMVTHLMLGLTLLASFRVLLWPEGLTPLVPALTAALFLGTLVLLGMTLRRYHPHPGPWPLWLAALYAAIAMASWCHLSTWFTSYLGWRGIRYRVTSRGRVTAIEGD